MTKWPSTIPQTPVLGNYTETISRNTVFSNFDVGPQERRRRSTIRTYPIEATFEMSRVKATIFTSFFLITLKYGVTPFTWNHPVTGATLVAQFLEAPVLTAKSFDWYAIDVKLQLTE